LLLQLAELPVADHTWIGQPKTIDDDGVALPLIKRDHAVDLTHRRAPHQVGRRRDWSDVCTRAATTCNTPSQETCCVLVELHWIGHGGRLRSSLRENLLASCMAVFSVRQTHPAHLAQSTATSSCNLDRAAERTNSRPTA
jgi:hypothetical protein